MDFGDDEVVHFGVFELDLAARQLTKRGRRVHLQDKPYETLVLLLERGGGLVTRDELRQRLWPADTFVAFDDSVNTAVRKLREALGDSADSPRFVETVPRHGYRFIAPIAREARVSIEAAPKPPTAVAPAHDGESVTTTSGQEREIMSGKLQAAGHDTEAAGLSRLVTGRVGRALILSSVSLGAFLAIGLTGGWYASRGATDSQEAPTSASHLRRLTFESGYHASPSWASEASTVVFAAARDGNVDLWLQHVRGGLAMRLTDDAAADWQPSVSRDGGRIAFRSERGGGGLFIMPVLGGPPVRVTDFGYSPQWSPEGDHVLFFQRQVRTTEFPPALFVVGMSGDRPRPVAQTLEDYAPAFCCFRGVGWHPDGRRISALFTDFGKRWVFVTYDIDSDTPVVSDTSRAASGNLESDRELGEERLFGSLAWSPRGESVYFLAYSGGVRSIWRVRVDPKTLSWLGGPDRITMGPTSLRDFSLSPAGDRVVFSTYDDSVRLWALPRDATTGQLKSPGSAIDTDGEWAGAPDISPDGTRMVYVNAGSGLREVRIRQLETGTERALFPRDGFLRSHPRWSGDGRALSYSRRMARPAGVWSDAALFQWSEALDQESLLTSPGSSVGVAQAWSQGSDLLLVVWFDTNVFPPRAAVALLETTMAPTAERTVRVIVSERDYNLYAQDLSPDGGWVGYNAVPRNQKGVAASRLFIASVVPGRTVPVSEGDRWEDKLQWSDDGRFVYFVSDAGGFFNIWARPFEPESGTMLGEAMRVTQFVGPAWAMPAAATASSLNFAVSRDLIVVPVVEREGSVWSLDLVTSGGGLASYDTP